MKDLLNWKGLAISSIGIIGGITGLIINFEMVHSFLFTILLIAGTLRLTYLEYTIQKEHIDNKKRNLYIKASTK